MAAVQAGKYQIDAANPDGLVLASHRVANSDFESEAALSSYLEENITLFCGQLGYSYISHAVDSPISDYTRFGPRGRRVDMLVECKEKLLIIELKNPRTGTDVRAGIGQILDYGREFPDTEKKELFLITTRFDIHTARTIKHYSLPIRLFYMSREHSMEYVDG